MSTMGQKPEQHQNNTSPITKTGWRAIKETGLNSTQFLRCNHYEATQRTSAKRDRRQSTRSSFLHIPPLAASQTLISSRVPLRIISAPARSCVTSSPACRPFRFLTLTRYAALASIYMC
uniref:Uncharacterized protein n=1 Tax=Triticum urartu TaxID=4572 RepID=A0A8R7PYU2_TRIUA